MRNFKSVIYLLLIMIIYFSVGCLNNNKRGITHFKQNLNDTSAIFVVSYSGFLGATTPNRLWILRKTTSTCYFTGIIAEIIQDGDRMKIENITDSGFVFAIHKKTMNTNSEWTNYNINYRDTFCFNEDCIKYLTNCEEFE